MIGRIEERVDCCDGHPLLRLSHLHDFVARTHLAFPQDAEVEPRPSAGCQQSRHPGLVHPNADAIAGDARLGDLEQRAADLIPVADADGIILQSFDREVLAELSMDEVGPLQLLLPVAIRFDLVDEDGALFTAVPGEIALAVSIQIQPACATSAIHWIFPDRGVNRTTPPLDVLWKSVVYRQEPSHGARLCLLAVRNWNVEVAIRAVWNDGLTGRKMELNTIELYRDDIRFEREQVIDTPHFSIGVPI